MSSHEEYEIAVEVSETATAESPTRQLLTERRKGEANNCTHFSGKCGAFPRVPMHYELCPSGFH